MASPNLLKALAVTAELTGAEMSPEAARVMADDLSSYPEPQIMGALTRCRRELRGRLTIAEIISRIDDGRPGPQEAWAMMPRSEADTVVWTDEMAAAWGVANLLLSDEVAARMAFIETYQRDVTRARANQKPVNWFASLGWDQAGRESVIARAVEQGRLTAEHAKHLLPNATFEERTPRNGEVKSLADLLRAGAKELA